MHLYHIVPEPLEGSTLIPLNRMIKSSDLYKKNVQKYLGREELLEVQVPKLNCRWNDVIHFSSIDPTIIAREILRVDPSLKFRRTKYFRVHVSAIVKQYEAAIFDKTHGDKNTFHIDDSEITILSEASYEELNRVPEATLDYWREAKALNRPLLWFMHIPHIMVKGEVDTTGFEVLDF